MPTNTQHRRSSQGRTMQPILNARPARARPPNPPPLPRRSREAQPRKDTPKKGNPAPMTIQPTIPIPRATLERLVALLTKSYDRTPSREVKQATDTIRHLLQSEKKDRIA